MSSKWRRITRDQVALATGGTLVSNERPFAYLCVVRFPTVAFALMIGALSTLCAQGTGTTRESKLSERVAALDPEVVRLLFQVLASETEGDFGTAVQGIVSLNPSRRILALDELVRRMTSNDPSQRLWCARALSDVMLDTAKANGGSKTLDVRVTIPFVERAKFANDPFGHRDATVEILAIELKYNVFLSPAEFETIRPKIRNWWEERRGSYLKESQKER